MMSVDDVGAVAIRQAPALTVLAFVVFMYVKDRGTMTEQFARQLEIFRQVSSEMFAAVLTTSQNCSGIQEQNNAAMTEVRDAVRELTMEIRRMNGRFVQPTKTV